MYSQKELEFNNLLTKYSNLTEEERSAYLVYKSNFFNLINDLGSISDFIDMDEDLLEKLINNKSLEKCRVFGKALNNSNNIFIKYSLFNDVDFSDNISLIKFAKKIYQILDSAFLKITTDRDLEVYRIVSLDENDELEDLSRSDFISTTLDKEQTLEFINESSKKVLFYRINIEAGTPIIISPYSIVNEYESLYDLLNNTENYSIKIRKNEGNRQKEVLLSKKSLEYSLNLEKTEEIDGQQFYYYEVNTKVKKDRKNYL